MTRLAFPRHKTVLLRAEIQEVERTWKSRGLVHLKDRKFDKLAIAKIKVLEQFCQFSFADGDKSIHGKTSL